MNSRQCMNFLKEILDAHLDEKWGYHCLLPNYGSSTLHDICKTGRSKDLRKFLNKYKGTVDLVDIESGVTPLVTACRMGDLDSVKLLVQRGANVNHICSGFDGSLMKYDKITPIFVAAAEGHESIVEYLGNHGADVNVQMSPLGLTPLHQAVYYQHKEVVSVLVKQFKAKVSIPCAETPSSFPMHCAIGMEDHGILTLLLGAEDADPDIPDPTEKVTPLHWAVYRWNAKAAEILISSGANVNVQLKSGHTPLDLAIQEKQWHIAKYMKGRGARRKVMHKFWHPFVFCVVNGLETLKEAVRRGADINCLLAPKVTALHYCVSQCLMTSCKFLVRKGADVNRKDMLGRTPLHLASERGLNEFVKFLLDNGANINSRMDQGLSPLHKAAMTEKYTTCQLLIDNGADIEAMSPNLGPPLLDAILQSNVKMIKLFLKSGANPNAKNSKTCGVHVSALQIAVQFAAKKPKILKALITAGADVQAPILTHHGTLSYLHVLPMVTGKVKSLKVMIEAGAFLDSPTIQTSNDPLAKYCVHFDTPHSVHCLAVRYHGTPLKCVKEQGHPELVRILEATDNLFKAVRKDDIALAEEYHAQGGLVNCCSIRYATPLTYASWKGFVQMVKFLLDKCAKMNMTNVQNSSPLHYAAKYNQKEVVIELLKAGADLKLIKFNKTPLKLAQEHNHSDVIAVLEFTKQYLHESGSTKISPIPDWKSDPTITRLSSGFDGKVSQRDLQALFEV